MLGVLRDVFTVSTPARKHAPVVCCSDATPHARRDVFRHAFGFTGSSGVEGGKRLQHHTRASVCGEKTRGVSGVNQNIKRAVIKRKCNPSRGGSEGVNGGRVGGSYRDECWNAGYGRAVTHTTSLPRGLISISAVWPQRLMLKGA